MLGSLFVSDFDVAEVLLEVDIDHVLRNGAPELIRVDVDLHLGFFVAPRELTDFLCRHAWCRLSCRHFSLGLRVGLYQHWVTSVDLSIFTEVLSPFCRETLRCMCIVVLIKEKR